MALKSAVHDLPLNKKSAEVHKGFGAAEEEKS
jgi:hypothetical protein